MPGLVAFGRRWAVGSDDLFLPSIILCLLHLVWFITTVIALIVDYDTLSNREQVCAAYVLEIICSILVILSATIFIELGLTIISLRGSILNDSPRKPAQYLIYTRVVVLLSELVWSGFSIAWIKKFYLDCDLIMTKQVMLGLVICTCFVILALMITAWCTYDVAGRSWVKMKRYQANMKEMERKKDIYKRSGSRHRNWRQRKVIRAYQDSWNHRCRLLFCCIHSKQNRDSFADLARLLSEFFRDLDVVPSDVVVGLLLLRRLQRLEQCSIVKQRRNNTYEFLSGIAITPKTKFVALNDPKDLETFRNVVHYMQYASAAYGWPWYVIPNGVSGVWKLCSNIRCCCHHEMPCRKGGHHHQSDLSEVVVEDNCCYCNYAVIPTMFASGTFDVIYATYHVDVGETPFFVVVDYEKEAVVVSIRGTLSLKDVITDLNAEGEPLPIDPPREDWLAHKGMVQAAVYMKSKLFEEKILETAFNRNLERHTDTYRLVLVGHSLGAGTASILAVLLKKEYPNLKCYAYSPPGGLFSMPIVEYSKEFVTSVIVGKDVVPRIGLSQMEALRADLINAIKKSQKPKWHTIMSGVWCCCCLKPEFARPQRLSCAPSIQSEEFMRTRRSLRDVREVTIHPNESAISLTVHQPLYPPGRIMHIVRHHPKKDEIKYENIWRRVIKKGEPVFQALWTDNTDYGQVLVSPGMIQDHMPDQVLHALQRVLSTRNRYELAYDPFPFEFIPFSLHASSSQSQSSEKSGVREKFQGDGHVTTIINHQTTGSIKDYNQHEYGGGGGRSETEKALQKLEQVVNNHGPAKPQRTGLAASSTSPLMTSKESLAGEGVSVVGIRGGVGADDGVEPCGSNVMTVKNVMGSGSGGSPKKNGLVVVPCLETSLTSMEDAGSSLDSKSSPECTLLNPSPLIIDADADIADDGDVTPTNLGLSDILASLNLSWDYVTSLQERFLEKEKVMGHERKSSMGNNSSSGCSEEGSTFKEIFGPIKYEDWMAPLASPETLSEISSLSSRASFLIPKDQSPLLRMKVGRNGNSASLHRGRNGKVNGVNGSGATVDNNGTNGSHSRSLSCTYPEAVHGSGELATISSSVCDTILSHSQRLLPLLTNGNGNDGDDAKAYLELGEHHPFFGGESEHSDYYMEVTNGGVLPAGSGSPSSHHNFPEDDAMTPVAGDMNGSYVELLVDDPQASFMQSNGSVDEGARGNGSSTSCAGSGEGKRVSFNLRRKYASKDSGCSMGDLSIPLTPNRYEPIYPLFTQQEEYGVPCFNSPHYTYSGLSPQEESPGEMLSTSLSHPSSPSRFSYQAESPAPHDHSSSDETSPHPPSSISGAVSSLNPSSPLLGSFRFASDGVSGSVDPDVISATTISEPCTSESDSTATFIQIADLEAHREQHQEPSDNSEAPHHQH